MKHNAAVPTYEFSKVVSAASQPFNLIANGSQSARLLPDVDDKESSSGANGDKEHPRVMRKEGTRADFYVL